MKICKDCNLEKPLDAFGKPTATRRHGKEYWYRKNDCLDCRNAKAREVNTFYHVKHKYGLDRETYEQMLASGCEVCGTHERLFVDHDHNTGEVRGILCNGCNSAEGFLKGNPDLAISLAAYMLKNTNVLENING